MYAPEQHSPDVVVMPGLEQTQGVKVFVLGSVFWVVSGGQEVQVDPEYARHSLALGRQLNPST